MHVNPTEFLSPAIALAVGILPVLYFRWKGSFFGAAAMAYIFAIAAKAIVQASFPNFFQTPSLPTYLAYGLLTFVFEVGLAYLILLPFWKGETAPTYHAGWTYGVYLAFYENALLLGALPLLTLLVVSSPAVQLATNPYAVSFLPVALPYLGERTSSLIAHATWGLVVYAALWRRRPWLVLTALPMAMIDAIAAWWDFTHAVSYPLLVVIFLTYTVLTAIFALIASGLWPQALAGLRRPARSALTIPPAPPAPPAPPLPPPPQPPPAPPLVA